MDCPICGHKMEENDVFCSNCGNYVLPTNADPAPPTEDSSVDAPCADIPVQDPEPPKKVAERLYPPPESPAPEPAARPAEKPAVSPASHQRLKVLATVLSCVTLVAVAAAVYILVTTSSLRVQLSKAQKASLTAQSQATELEAQVSSLTDSLDAAKSQNADLSAQVSDLTGKVGELETSVNQNEYDKTTAQRELEEAKTALTTAQEEKTALETQLTESQDALSQAQTDLEDAQAENEELQDENSAYKSEISFYDTYVVFVMLDSPNKYYHKYGCAQFTQRNFLAYSTKLAEANGYTPCPDCIG